MDKIKVFLRSSLFFLLFTMGIIGFATYILLLVPVTNLSQRRRVVPSWGKYNRAILAATCGLTVRVWGRENLPPPPYVILCKHQSAWETVTLQALFPECVLVLKKSLLKIPFFGWGLMATGQIAIDRSQGVKALRLMAVKCQEVFDVGRTVLIFPEGTRVEPGEVGKYNPGGVGMALTAGVPIVPVAHNAGSFWRPRAFLKQPGEIQLRIGAAIPTAGLGKGDRKALTRQVQDAVEGMMAEINDSWKDGQTP
ncbi:MAG: 1-acyl-sn-glycerol-3-phosphate acyltransferase [Magnetococcales bacterium]|nr:1-acyl-sn-glycerol-3-phosphate acyltransferase [Magnetococcales bacterium]